MLGLWALREAALRRRREAGAGAARAPRWCSSPATTSSRSSRCELSKGELDVVAVHPMSSVPMGDDPVRAAVGSDGKHHHLENLWVADGSLFPTSIGVPPQLSIYAMGLPRRADAVALIHWLSRLVTRW